MTDHIDRRVLARHLADLDNRGLTEARDLLAGLLGVNTDGTPAGPVTDLDYADRRDLKHEADVAYGHVRWATTAATHATAELRDESAALWTRIGGLYQAILDTINEATSADTPAGQTTGQGAAR